MHLFDLVIKNALSPDSVRQVDIAVTFTDSAFVTHYERAQMYDQEFRSRVLRELSKEFIIISRKDAQILSSIDLNKSNHKT